ncbi:hypothetical protein ACFE04_012599 [Oxalis oulophora]
MAATPSPVIHSDTATSPSSSTSWWSSLLSPSTAIIILILTTTLVVSIGICLILRLLNQRCLRHLSTINSTSSDTAVNSLRHSGHRVSPETTDSAVNSLINSLPIFTFASVKRRGPSAFNAGDCVVCLSKFEADDQLRLLPLCCHAFHVDCIDVWLATNQSCPLCRSVLHASDSDLTKASSYGSRNFSFRLQIGSLRRSRDFSEPRGSSYSVGSFDYVVEEESEIVINQTNQNSASEKEDNEPTTEEEETLAAEVGEERNWLQDYVDRLSSASSRAFSFRSSGRFFNGSSRRNDIIVPGDNDVEANRMGEEISEMFRWLSGM